MSERLTVSLEDGSVERLRQLAGGQRKVGTFLSGAIQFLFGHAELIKTHDWRDLVITQALFEDALYQELVRMQKELSARLEAIEAREAAGRPPE